MPKRMYRRPSRVEISRAMRAWSLMHGPPRPPEMKRAAAGKQAARESDSTGNKSTRSPSLLQRGSA